MKLLILLALSTMAISAEFSGDISFSQLGFIEQDEKTTNENTQLVIDGSLKFTSENSSNNTMLNIEGIYRKDFLDNDRNIAVPTDTYIKYQGETFSISGGYQIFNWSVMEFFHPIDTINSKNFDTALDKTERLGLPTFVLSKDFESSLFQFIFIVGEVLPKMPSKKNRQSFQLDLADSAFATDNNKDSDSRGFSEYGIRFKKLFDSLELDLQLFRKYATHSPFFLAKGPANAVLLSGGDFDIQPTFFPMTQTSFALTYPISEIMLKAEAAFYDFDNFKQDIIEYVPGAAISVKDSEFIPLDYAMSALGMEYTKNYTNQQEGTYFAEYSKLFNIEPKIAQLYSIFQNDLALGYRHNFNNFNSWEFAGSYIIDLDNTSESIFNLTSSFRFMQDYKFEGKLNVVNAKATSSSLYDVNSRIGLRPLRLSDFIKLKVTRYF